MNINNEIWSKITW